MGALKSLISLAIDASANYQSSRRTPSPELTTTYTTTASSTSPLARSHNSLLPQSPETRLQVPQESGITTTSSDSTTHEDRKEVVRGTDADQVEDQVDEFQQLQRYARSEYDHTDSDSKPNRHDNEEAIPSRRPPPFKFDLHTPSHSQPQIPPIYHRLDASSSPEPSGMLGYPSPPTTELEHDNHDGYPLSSDEREEATENKTYDKNTLLADIALAVEMVRARKQGMRKTKRDRLAVGVDVFRSWKRRDEKRREGNGGEVYCVPTL